MDFLKKIFGFGKKASVNKSQVGQKQNKNIKMPQSAAPKGVSGKQQGQTGSKNKNVCEFC